MKKSVKCAVEGLVERLESLIAEGISAENIGEAQQVHSEIQAVRADRGAVREVDVHYRMIKANLRFRHILKGFVATTPEILPDAAQS
jgi:hypothetical protein